MLAEPKLKPKRGCKDGIVNNSLSKFSVLYVWCNTQFKLYFLFTSDVNYWCRNPSIFKKAFLFANKYSTVLVTTRSKTALLSSCFTWNWPSEQTTVTIFYFLCWSFKTSTKEITNIRYLHTRHHQNVLKRTSYFDGEIRSYHAVPGCQVSVDKLLGIKVSHAVCDLSSHLDHLFQSGWRTPRIVLWDMRQIFIFWSANTEMQFYFI